MNTKHKQAWAMLAQAVVNIDEGHTTIEPGSAVHDGMKDLIADPVYESAPELLAELDKACNVIAHCISEMPEAYREAMRTQLKSGRTAIIKASAQLL